MIYYSSSYLQPGLDPFIFFLVFKFKFKFIDFEKIKFKFIDFEKTKFKFIDFEKSKFKFKFIDFAKVEFKFKFSITCERIQIQIQNSNSIQPPLFTPKIQKGFCNLHLASRSLAVADVY